MKDAALEEIQVRLTLVEFAIQDLNETDLVESAQDALVKVCALCRTLERYVEVRKEKENGNRI